MPYGRDASHFFALARRPSRPSWARAIHGVASLARCFAFARGVAFVMEGGCKLYSRALIERAERLRETGLGE